MTMGLWDGLIMSDMREPLTSQPSGAKHTCRVGCWKSSYIWIVPVLSHGYSSWGDQPVDQTLVSVGNASYMVDWSVAHMVFTRENHICEWCLSRFFALLSPVDLRTCFHSCASQTQRCDEWSNYVAFWILHATGMPSDQSNRNAEPQQKHDITVHRTRIDTVHRTGGGPGKCHMMMPYAVCM